MKKMEMNGERVKRIRYALGLSQKKLAALLGLKTKNGHTTVRTWENNKVTTPGPSRLSLFYLYQGTANARLAHGLGERIIGTMEVKQRDGSIVTKEVVMHLKTPRHIGDADTGEVLQWIDPKDALDPAMPDET